VLATLATATLAAVNEAAADIYTHEQIALYVANNFGGTSWNFLHQN